MARSSVSNGRVALVGSGEFTPATERVDRELLEGVAPRVVFLPTASALEGRERVSYWAELGATHYSRLGVDAAALMVLDRASADSTDLAALIASAGLVYMSGGDPTYLASTLVGSRVGAAIIAAWRAGSSVAGCSAGAMALMENVPDIRQRGEAVDGLGLVAGMRVVPHYDVIERWLPGIVQRTIDATPPGVHLIGIDEDTAIVGGPLEWRVMGRGKAWMLGDGEEPVGLSDGAVVALPAGPDG